jgi:nucleoside phosphorylase
VTDRRRVHRKADPTCAEVFDYRYVFSAGWELANWASSSHCPNSNVMLAEFSARLPLDWPPRNMTSEQYVSKTRRALQGGVPHLRHFFDIGFVSNKLVIDTRSLKQNFKKRPHRKKLVAKRLMAAQAKFATLLAKVGATAKERELLVSAVQGLLNHSEDKAVPILVDSLGILMDRSERDLVNDKLNQLLGNNIKGKIDVAIITVREDEHAAVIERFPQMRLFHAGNRSYSISIVPLKDGGQYVIAVVKSIEQGEGNGQDVARDAIEDLDPSWLFLVGICGAVPAAEFTLGDVVIDNRVIDFSVRAALEGGSTQYSAGGGPMHKRTQNYLALIPAISEKLGHWNSVRSIRVRRPKVDCKASRTYGSRSWRRKVVASLARHFGSRSLHRSPIVTHGAVVSADTLVKDTDVIKSWQQSARQVAAVEMELGGVYIAARRPNREYPIVAIRGISDIIGLERDADWTQYACNSAAAFALGLVSSETLPPICRGHSAVP